MTRLFFVALLSAALTGPVLAQLQLGERPIKRTEVAAVAKAQFAEMDADKDGSVSPSEFERYRARQNARPDQGRGLTHIGRSWFGKCDTDGDGRVSLAEAVARPLGLFDMADADGDGVASLAEQQLASIFIK